MTEFLDFMAENWKWILALVLSIVNILICALRKRTKVVDSVKEFILKWLPQYINIVEKYSDLKGTDKKEKVLLLISDLLSSQFDGIDIDNYVDFISDSIESILSTPQKKGV